ncbi:MAG: DUF58 domain-containing protein [Bacteroidia bacterium]|jgi:uncharacterized protein (DUF58 family)|nr:DUF58 domain-containing protein [Sphingobacteriaceae bacterium]MBP9068895.1 DUF58 domain-containing protein [Bacteroidia bacterium]
METAELLKKVRKIEIKTRGLSKQIFSGEYHSAFKGRGMAFSEVREYTPGDDVRSIDWNVTARFNAPFVKIFEEERELSVMLLVDVSASGLFGTYEKIKQDLITELCAVISFSATTNNDKIGIIFFSDKIEKFIPPKKGKTHVLRVIRELINFTPQQKATNIEVPLKFLTNAIKKRSIAFLISDFYAPFNYTDALKISNKRHDVVAVRIMDKTELELPDVGLIKLRDNESGKVVWVDSGSKEFRKQYHSNRVKFDHDLKDLFNRSGIDSTAVYTNESYVKPLMNLFKKR